MTASAKKSSESAQSAEECVNAPPINLTKNIAKLINSAIHNAVLNLLFGFCGAGSWLQAQAIVSTRWINTNQRFSQKNSTFFRYHSILWKKQLIKANSHAENNYKYYYDDETLKRLIFIKRCPSLDMTLHEISQLTEQIQYSWKNCKIIDQLIEKHIQHIETKIKELTSFKSKLYELRQSYTSNTTIYHYKIVKNLGKSE